MYLKRNPLPLVLFAGFLFKFLPRPASVCLWLQEIRREPPLEDEGSSLFRETIIFAMLSPHDHEGTNQKNGHRTGIPHLWDYRDAAV